MARRGELPVNAKVLVAGAGRSGIGACRLLADNGIEATLYDGNVNLDREKLLSQFESGKAPKLLLGDLAPETAKEYDICVISPGIPMDSPVALTLNGAGVPVWSEIELAYELSAGRLAAITGTNGKTTTTALVGEMLANEYEKTFVVGNIGTAYTGEASKMTEDCATVVEVSSFQLETIIHFHPQVSAILNITPDHLNRHKTMENYIACKENVTLNQTAEDTCVLNYEDEVLREFGKTLVCKVVWFSSARELDEGLFLRGDEIMLRENGTETDILSVKKLNIVGRHNYENAMAACGVALAMGVSLEHVRQALKSFQAVEHRIEFVIERDGVVYYNDSKGTNPDAAIKGIEAMSRPTWLIGGGYDKKSDYREWLTACIGRIRCLVLIGATADAIEKEARELGITQIYRAGDLKTAVDYCKEHAAAGEAVLLSPACASWDQFESYEQRGRMFKDFARQA